MEYSFQATSQQDVNNFVMACNHQVDVIENTQVGKIKRVVRIVTSLPKQNLVRILSTIQNGKAIIPTLH